MKKFVLVLGFIGMGIRSLAHSIREIDTNVVASFQSHFPNASQTSWHEFAETYEVLFFDNGIQEKIAYRKDRSQVTITRYYTGVNLPYELYYILSKRLPGKKVFAVMEISTITEPRSQLNKEYLLTMEDDTKWYHGRMSDDGSFRIEKKYAKG